LFLVPGWEHPEHLWTRWPWNLVALAAVACASYYLIETPLLRLGGRVAARFARPVTVECEKQPALV
jgi:peptidoglycan/LPS O-acetylase OafA/YrhL